MNYSKTGRTICLIGESGAGKSTVAQMLAEKYDYQRLNLSDQVREHASELGYLNTSREELQLLANQAREAYGNDYFARRSMAHTSEDADLVVEGIRHFDEYECIRNSRSGKFLTTGIFADHETRFNRVLGRARPSDPIDYEQFLINDEREWGVGGTEFSQNTELLMAMVDVVIYNDGGIDELYEAVTRMLEMFVFTTNVEGIHPDPETTLNNMKGPERE